MLHCSAECCKYVTLGVLPMCHFQSVDDLLYVRANTDFLLPKLHFTGLGACSLATKCCLADNISETARILLYTLQ